MLELDSPTIERLCADAWPAVVDRRLGEWRLRAADGFTGRANSALVLGAAPGGVAAACAAVREFAATAGITPKLQVMAGDEHEDALRELGWRIDENHCGERGVDVLTAPVRAWLPGGADVTLLTEPSEAWWRSTVGAAQPSDAERHVLSSYHDVGFAVLGDGIATARFAITGPLLHVSRLAVRRDHRRRGLARAVLAAGAQWAVRRGIDSAVLQVDGANTGALALYHGLGASVRHRYRYWIAMN